jgi:glycosyltransferase involved in cell wall biosynthesis
MRILYVNKLYPPDLGGGAEVTLASIVTGVRARGVEARVVTTSSAPVRQVDSVDGVEVVRLPLRNLYWHNDTHKRPRALTLLWHGIDSYNLAMQSALRREIAAFAPDLISFHNLVGFSASAWAAAADAGVPAVQVLHDYYHLCARSQLHRGADNCDKRCVSCRMLRFGRGRASRRLQAVVGISQAVLDRHLEAGVFADVELKTVIHNARAMQPAAARPAASHARTFGYLGTLGAWKGVEQLLAAFEQLRTEPGTSDLRLLIAGRGDDSYEAALKRRFAGPACEFLGQVKPKQLLSQVDALVVPSLWHEPLGMVTVEALMAGVPVIAAARGGIPETVCDGENGLLYDPTRPEALTACMRRLAQEQGLAARLAARSVASVARFTDVQRMLGEYLSLYERLTRRVASHDLTAQLGPRVDVTKSLTSSH